MVDINAVALSDLPLASDLGNLGDLPGTATEHFTELQVEAQALTGSVKSDISQLNGPARDGELNPREFLQSFQKTTEMSVRLHENLAQFAVLTSSATSFGNNLNTFLKGQ